MSRKTLAWANKEVETFVCILGEEDVVYDVYVAAAAIDIRPTTKGTVGSGNATSELSWAIPPPPYCTFAIRSVPHPAVETRHKRYKASGLMIREPGLKLAWANKEVETFVCILGEEDVVYDVYVAAAAIDIRPTTKGTVGSGNATSELSWANRSLPTAPLRSDPFRTLQWKCGNSI
ncbi:unnamed protein product [Boreogadus saida]